MPRGGKSKIGLTEDITCEEGEKNQKNWTEVRRWDGLERDQGQTKLMVLIKQGTLNRG